MFYNFLLFHIILYIVKFLIFYLLEDKEIYNIVMNVKELIISFFINQIEKGYADSESLIFLLTLSPNYNLRHFSLSHQSQGKVSVNILIKIQIILLHMQVS